MVGRVTHWGIMLAWIVLGLVILVGTNILLFYLMFQGLTFWWETEIFWWNRVQPPPHGHFFPTAMHSADVSFKAKPETELTPCAEI